MCVCVCVYYKDEGKKKQKKKSNIFRVLLKEERIRLFIGVNHESDDENDDLFHLR